MFDLKIKTSGVPLKKFTSLISENCFTFFTQSIEGILLPETFTFPFYYEPHPLALLASEQLQSYLDHQVDFEHNFGSENSTDPLALGKMFGVLVVRAKNGQLGYLSAFSGKLANSNHHKYFVPPIFDILQKDGFYKIEEEEVNELNRELVKAQENPSLLEKRNAYYRTQQKAEKEISLFKNNILKAKAIRKQQRIDSLKNLSREQYTSLNLELNKQSSEDHFFLKDLKKRWKIEIEKAKAEQEIEEEKIKELKIKRGKRSAALQRKIFSAYSFLNAKGENKSLLSIFEHLQPLFPPSGAGECAAPKLLHYAYQHNFEPIALAEFWWGKTPSSEIRQHKNYYPACKSKCEPILGHMLKGLSIDENPLLNNPSYGKEIEIIFEDESILVLNKPAEFLSVPGIHLTDSVETRMKEKYPEATGPMIVHRLDMSTSGLMLLAKTKEVHKILQSLFIKRTMKKEYVALLDGLITQDEGTIDLPLRLDIEDRPRQLVCFEHGKTARTTWRVVERKNGKTKIKFTPITGRTHQLRVHSAHQLGLNTPILGDDLYGKKSDRLYLHAQRLAFSHPISGKNVVFEIPSDF